MMIDRPAYQAEIRQILREHPVAALLGPRQCGKTTLARALTREMGTELPITFIDLEEPEAASRLAAPMQALAPLNGLVVIDEVQRLPSLFQLLRVLVDRPDRSTKFLLLGSASPQLVRGASESLAGRIGFVDMAGFDLSEIAPERMSDLWLRGSFPRSFLAESDYASYRWREQFVRTFLERDLPQLGITVPSATLSRFWAMLCHFHGNIWNAAELARSLGASEPTARRYRDLLTGAFMVRQLPPWHENIRKRQVKMPKVYVRDSGLLHAILHLSTPDEVRSHPKLGASWEGFALEQVIRHTRARDCYFWATHSGAELDLMVPHRGKRFGFEFKHADAPTVTRSMRAAMETLRLHRLFIVYPGEQRYPLDEQIDAVGLTHLASVELS